MATHAVRLDSLNARAARECREELCNSGAAIGTADAGVEVGRLERGDPMRGSIAGLFGVLLFVGCNEVTSPSTARETFTVATYDWKQDSFVEPLLEGVEICQTDTANCAMTDADGMAKLDLPLDQEISCTLEKKEYLPVLFVRSVRTTQHEHTLGLVPDESAKELFEVLTSRYPPIGTGWITIYTNPRRAGVTFGLVDATGQRRYYMDEDVNPSPHLEATTSAGYGGFVEVSPGEHRIQVGGNVRSCAVFWGWPDDESSFRIPVREGYNTLASVSCPLPP